jgi:hypothetical protein
MSINEKDTIVAERWEKLHAASATNLSGVVQFPPTCQVMYTIPYSIITTIKFSKGWDWKKEPGFWGRGGEKRYHWIVTFVTNAPIQDPRHWDTRVTTAIFAEHEEAFGFYLECSKQLSLGIS